ncbi:hypothetical protein VNO80_10325 [Phaseolus coccineus]|uniref:Uncharacterized protein n=1 Tax=Phaseolus coccineus TaxID=3886 RepID=A0AAN9RAC9_PHACN
MLEKGVCLAGISPIISESEFSRVRSRVDVALGRTNSVATQMSNPLLCRTRRSIALCRTCHSFTLCHTRHKVSHYRTRRNVILVHRRMQCSVVLGLLPCHACYVM